MTKSNILITLMELLSIESYSGKERPVIEYVTPKLIEYGFKVEYDALGNIYAVRGESTAYPCLNAHMDSVEGYIYTYKASTLRSCTVCIHASAKDLKTRRAICNIDVELPKAVDTWKAYKCDHFVDELELVDEEVEATEEFILSYNEKTKKLTSNESRPMGGDDKCGMAIALDIARTTEIPMKILFNVQEETGCHGSDYAIKNHFDWFDDVLYGLTIDRRGADHICVTTGGERSASNYFIGELAKWACISGIAPKFEKGSMSDNFGLKALVPNFINISAGYYSAHRNSEYVQIDELKLIRNWVKNFLTKGDIK